MVQVSVQRRKERRPFIHQSHSRVTPTLNTALMAFGGAEEPFQVEVVYRQLNGIAADEEPRGEGAHRLAYLPPRGIRIAVEPSCENEE